MSSTAPDTSTGAAPSATPTRRQVLVTGSVVAAAVAVTAACGSSADAPAAAGGATLKTSDVPVGGGKILADQKVVVTQPTAGQFKAFTAVCTHQGCTVAAVSGGSITCACHNSAFSATDGSVQQGPASAPLAAKNVTVSGDTITVA